MAAIDEILRNLNQITNVTGFRGRAAGPVHAVRAGGPADVYAETDLVPSFVEALELARSSGLPYTVMGGGTNLVVSDEGFRGIVLRFTASGIVAAGARVAAEAGAGLQQVVDFAIERGLGGLETLAGIPGSLGAPSTATPEPTGARSRRRSTG